MVDINIQDEDSLVIKIRQNINFVNVEKLNEDLRDIPGQNVKNVIMDFSQVQIVDSAGVSFLLTFYDSLRKHDKKFYIKEANENVLHLFKLIGLEHLISEI